MTNSDSNSSSVLPLVSGMVLRTNMSCKTIMPAKKAVTIEKGDPEVNAAGGLALHPVTRRKQAINDHPQDGDDAEADRRAGPRIGIGPPGDRKSDAVNDVEDGVRAREPRLLPVSYTHLTLPTILRV